MYSVLLLVIGVKRFLKLFDPTPKIGYPHHMPTITLADDHLILDFPYNQTQVAEIKQIDGAKWDKD